MIQGRGEITHKSLWLSLGRLMTEIPSILSLQFKRFADAVRFASYILWPKWNCSYLWRSLIFSISLSFDVVTYGFSTVTWRQAFHKDQSC